MYCNQCEQTSKGMACTSLAVCGKPENVSNLFDLILFQTKGISYLLDLARKKSKSNNQFDRFVIESLFLTVTNVNFDQTRVLAWARKAESILSEAAKFVNVDRSSLDFPEAVRFSLEGLSDQQILDEAKKHPITALHPNPDIQSLIQLMIYGLKGLAAYAEHAAILGRTDVSVFSYITNALAATLDPSISINQLVALNMKCGEINITCMKVLNEGHIEHFGKPVATSIFTGTKKGPAIIVSGHDLFMLDKLLEQTDQEGVNVYTHGEMLPAHGYPKLKAHKSLVGHFGTAWQNQQKEFLNQPAVFVFNTNCIQKPADSYKEQVFTTSVVGWPDVKHIEGYNFSALIQKAKDLKGFEEKDGKHHLMTGFGHDAVLAHADKIVEAVKSGAIKRFFVVGGCDGAKSGRNYYTDFVESAPKDTVILTLACGKFRFNHLQDQLGDIGGIPRLLDVGQCNDAYSAVVIATKLAEAFKCTIHDLPLSFVLSWYEQKAVVVLLSLLSLGIKNIKLGPSLPAFITPNVLDFLVKNFNIGPIGNSAKGDLEEICH